MLCWLSSTTEIFESTHTRSFLRLWLGIDKRVDARERADGSSVSYPHSFRIPTILPRLRQQSQQHQNRQTEKTLLFFLPITSAIFGIDTYVSIRALFDEKELLPFGRGCNYACFFATRHFLFLFCRRRAYLVSQ